MVVLLAGFDLGFQVLVDRSLEVDQSLDMDPPSNQVEVGLTIQAVALAYGVEVPLV